MKKLLSMASLGLLAGLSLSACTELVETQPGAAAPTFVNPLRGLTTPLQQTTTTTTTAAEKPRLANGRKNFGTPAKTTTTTTRVVAQPSTVTTIQAPVQQTVTTQTASSQVVGSQAIEVKTADGRTMILYPGQTYYGPDGRLYVYDPNALPVVTTGF